MTTFLSLRTHPLIISPIHEQPRASNSLSLQRSCLTFSNQKPLLRGSLGVARFGPSSFPDFDGSDGSIQHLFGRVEGILYTLADAAVSASENVDGVKQKEDWFSGIANVMETVLKVLKDGISTLHAPYAYGFAIILLTVIVKAATFPLTKKQVESSLAMRSLQPQVKAIQQRYAGDGEKIQIETARLYKLAGVNPLAGCLPTLATIPVWIGLYRALSNVADEGLLTEGFFWIPSLAGPTTIASRQNGSGISWLFPFIDGHPPLGWSDTLAYLVLPVLLVISQYISVQIMQSSQPQSNDPNMKTSQAITKFIPLMIGYFSLSVPSGLSLYWLTNNILSTAQQVWLQKLGGAKVTIRQLSDDSVKEEEQKIQKPVLEVSKTKVIESRQGEKSSSEGLRPGERFKMLKEQEARKKQQREEEKRKAEESVNGTTVASGEEVKLVTHEIEINESKVVDAGDERLHSETVVHGSSNTGVLNVNGSSKLSDNNQENVSLSSTDHAEKEEVELRNIKATTGAVVSNEDAQQERTE